MRTGTERRWWAALVAAAALVALATTVVGADPASAASGVRPASAAGVLCTESHDVSVGTKAITASRFLVCPGGVAKPLEVSIEKRIADGSFLLVADGLGTATYHCQGRTRTLFRVFGEDQFVATCT